MNHLHHYTLPSWYARVAIADLIVIVLIVALCVWLNKTNDRPGASQDEDR